MGLCSYHAYVDASEGPARVRVEATCGLYGAAVEAVTGAWRVEPRGGVVRLEYHSPWPRGFGVASSPCRPLLLPEPWPPFTPVDAEIVVDHPVGLDLHGLPERRTAVTPGTQRTLLGGRGYVALAVVERGDVLGAVEARVDALEALGAGAPLYSGIGELDRVLECEAARGMDRWAWCLERLGGPGLNGLLWRVAALPPGWERACLVARLYAALRARSGRDPLTGLLRVDSWVLPVVVRGRVLMASEDAVVGLRRGGVEEWRRLGPGTVPLEGYEEAALLCRDCWLRLPAPES